MLEATHIRDTKSAVEKFLDSARLKGERLVALTRTVVCALVVLQILFLMPEKFRAGAFREWVTLGVCVAGLLISLYTARRVSTKERKVSLLWVSVGIDALLVTVALSANALDPAPNFQGALRSSELALIVLATVSGSLRFHVPVAIFGSILNVVGLVAVLLVERHMSIVYTPAMWATAFIYSTAAVVISIAIASRGVRLIREGADAALKGERARQALGAYVSEEVAVEALAGSRLVVGGERCQVAVLFSDLRGFTAYGEKLTPEQLVAELNAYLQVMVPVIREEGGVVDKYIGDSIMAVFGIPATRPDDALRAFRAARKMQSALVEHNKARARVGLGPLKQGVGVHYGPVVAGNIGTPERLQYTVIGDVVNLASRLESATKEHGLEILISEDALNAAKVDRSDENWNACRKVGAINVRGRELPLLVHTVDAPRSDATTSVMRQT